MKEELDLELTLLLAEETKLRVRGLMRDGKASSKFPNLKIDTNLIKKTKVLLILADRLIE